MSRTLKGDTHTQKGDTHTEGRHTQREGRHTHTQCARLDAIPLIEMRKIKIGRRERQQASKRAQRMRGALRGEERGKVGSRRGREDRGRQRETESREAHALKSLPFRTSAVPSVKAQMLVDRTTAPNSAFSPASGWQRDSSNGGGGGADLGAAVGGKQWGWGSSGPVVLPTDDYVSTRHLLYFTKTAVLLARHMLGITPTTLKLEGP